MVIDTEWHNPVLETTHKRVVHCDKCIHNDKGFCQRDDVKPNEHKVKWAFNQSTIVGCTKGERKTKASK